MNRILELQNIIRDTFLPLKGIEGVFWKPFLNLFNKKTNSRKWEIHVKYLTFLDTAQCDHFYDAEGELYKIKDISWAFFLRHPNIMVNMKLQMKLDGFLPISETINLEELT